MNPSQQVPDHSLARPTTPYRVASGLRFLPLRTMVVLGLLTTLISSLASWFWIADLFAQFKIQVAIGLIGVSCLLVVSQRWHWFGICLVGILINVFPVWPYLAQDAQHLHVGDPIHATTDPGSMSFRLLSLNVLSSNQSYAEVLQLIETEQPDFVVLMEVTSNWEHELFSLQEACPCAKFQTRDDNFGIAFLSRFPWSEVEVFYSQALQLPSMDVRFESDSAGLPSAFGNLRIIATHPIPPISSQFWAARNEQLWSVAERFDSTCRNIMVGDLNLTPWSPCFSGILQKGCLADSARGFGVTPTWQLFPTWLGGLKIDHILVGPGVQPMDFRVGPDIGSDHRAVILDFGLPDRP